jgi:hypothetical protein
MLTFYNSTANPVIVLELVSGVLATLALTLI